MKIFDYIFYQVDGFTKAGKKLVKPKNDIEKGISKILAIISLLLAVVFYLFVFNSGFNVPVRIHIRALIYLVPWLGMAYKLYKGVSISWIINGIFKYWMIPLMLIWIYIVVMNMFYVIFFGGDINTMLISAGYMSIYSSTIYGVYFIKKAKATPAYYAMILLMGPLFVGGILMVLWGAGTLDWFHDEVLGW
ncbi:hypothetical protein ACFLRY_01845 [Bacteroidota bacterium]